ncbi:MAG TPA: response regulator [Stellaceae bacterium]|nr:response regulator [Stellaceae bacterium]
MKRRIFIVDDDRDHAESIADILSMQGHEIVMVYTGEEAVERFAEHLFDLTLMDVKLPGMNGVEAFFELRRQRADAQIVMMTGFSVEQHLSQALLSGARGVLRKPFAIADLLRAVDETDSPPEAERAA